MRFPLISQRDNTGRAIWVREEVTVCGSCCVYTEAGIITASSTWAVCAEYVWCIYSICLSDPPTPGWLWLPAWSGNSRSHCAFEPGLDYQVNHAQQLIIRWAPLYLYQQDVCDSLSGQLHLTQLNCKLLPLYVKIACNYSGSSTDARLQSRLVHTHRTYTLLYSIYLHNRSTHAIKTLKETSSLSNHVYTELIALNLLLEGVQ